MSRDGLGAGPEDGGQPVIGYPIDCAEPWARLSAADIPDTDSYYYRDSVLSAKWWQDVCPLIPTSRAASDYGPPRVSQTPVLMINGTADPQDPPANMAGAQRIWPDSRQIIEPWQGHSVDINAWSQCDAYIVQAFVESASVQRLDTGCLAQVALPAFATSW